MCMDSFALIAGESDSGLSLSVSVTIPLMSVSIHSLLWVHRVVSSEYAFFILGPSLIWWACVCSFLVHSFLSRFS